MSTKRCGEVCRSVSCVWWSDAVVFRIHWCVHLHTQHSSDALTVAGAKVKGNVWEYISQSINLYQNAGYEYIDVPWIVTRDALAVTLPPYKTGFSIFETMRLNSEANCLVGSAEQSFIDMMISGHPAMRAGGRYVAASPCFRDDAPDELHKTWFFKVELIDVFPGALTRVGPKREEAWRMCNTALRVMKDVAGAGDDEMKIVETPEGFDIEYCGIEVGSYGVRVLNHPKAKYEWVYGTGMAIPRFQIASDVHLKESRKGWDRFVELAPE